MKCSSTNLFYKSSGTERIEEELKTLFPDEKILRMDVDTTTTKGSHGRILTEFHDRKARILLGTQMVAKGLDFPAVTLVGVLMADIGLNIPDFRASERTFSLLTQVAGRAGRSVLPGEVRMPLPKPHRRRPAARSLTKHTSGSAPGRSPSAMPSSSTPPGSPGSRC